MPVTLGSGWARFKLILGLTPSLLVAGVWFVSAFFEIQLHFGTRSPDSDQQVTNGFAIAACQGVFEVYGNGSVHRINSNLPIVQRIPFHFENFAITALPFVSGRNYYTDDRRQSEPAVEWVVGIPFLFPFLISLIPGIRAAIAFSRRSAVGCCVLCGYDLRASLNQCPECGTRFQHGSSKRADLALGAER